MFILTWYILLSLHYTKINQACPISFWNMQCIQAIYEKSKVDKVESYLLWKDIKYKLWSNGPIYFDCWWIVRSALKSIWYKWDKIWSSYVWKFKPFKLAKHWDLLINKNKWQRHVARISEWYHNWKVTLLDYATDFRKAKYREHSSWKWVYIIDMQRLYNP